ncbi:hypothetical protein SEA_SATIS_111 [Streptomyces phage Satis]|nr:hypothetical protein SEA_SATIS_111 [Streptomyces phage Satis]QBZ72009.1 hypothetical protein SEA_KRADAL_111 [Streptomyces phage Kradal]QPL14429.1 hypothetical protein SEA_EHYELIMAYOE_112 [Streptomyces phage EhyElimayoE]
MNFLVTVKLAKNPGHNPREKKTGPCPVNGKPCTDVTGEHHTFLVDLDGHTLHGREMDAEGVREFYAGTYHVTRVETV